MSDSHVLRRHHNRQHEADYYPARRFVACWSCLRAIDAHMGWFAELEGPWWTGLTGLQTYIGMACHHCVINLADEFDLARDFDANNHPVWVCRHL